MMRFVSSGTEATMSAARLARAVTGRDFILKFDGCYHGHTDSLLVKAGSGMATPGPLALPCQSDAVCGTHHCNTQYGKCAFPCVDANVDCIQGAQCAAGFCIPKLPGT